ncbi:MAG TPA: glycosyltransferase family 2 protein [Bacteroidales bacterium]|nr:glycosyltransferase family 2 protein [Bacteroidales bacterium]
MIYLAYFIVGFAVVQLLVALVNLLWGRFTYDGHEVAGTLVSVLIPARNEANNIGNLMNDLKQQSFADIEILVFDDQSTDGTASIVELAAQTDTRIRIVRSEGLPEGWLGKNNACHQLAIHALGTYYLFLDADVRLDSDAILHTLEYMVHHQPILMSIFPRQEMVTVGEWSTVPVMNYILLTLLPLVLVSKSRYPSLSAANGQFMLFDAAVYRKTKPHEKLKSSRVEDIEIARYLKREGYKIACIAADSLVYCRMYKSFREALNGFAKNVTHFFGNSFVLAMLFWLITTLGFVLVVWLLPFEMGVLYLVIIFATRIVVAVSSGQQVLKNLLFFIPQHFALCLFIYTSYMNRQNKQMVWKDRNIS